MTRLIFVFAALLAIASGCGPGETEPAEQATDAKAKADTTPAPSDAGTTAKERALAAKNALFTKLSSRLVEAMSSGGPAAAIQVCSQDAVKIAAVVSESQGVRIGRTSFKLRNPRNAPPEWTVPFVEQRVAEPQFVELPDGNTGALLPIKLQTACLACHGPEDTIASDVKAKLAELYPEDQATGFHDGDLRGWFWVEVPASNDATDTAKQ
ncbi:MAG: DUF3365 domain-containing protein [Planctomycetales bacterium]|nr:DUF3365 domain-containing protein [Planctomycetales bacterium]